MKIMHILPELEEGGVERIVLMLANGQSRLGHEVYVVSNGGRLESLLSEDVTHIKMPVHRKNPFVGVPCAFRLARIVRDERVAVVHAHSRVPAWICYFVRKFEPSVKFVYTAHARFSTMTFLSVWPISQADGVTCVSNCVKEHFKGRLPRKNPARVIYNALPGEVIPWEGSSGGSEKKRLLFVGRISEKKGLITLMNALSMVKSANWQLDVLGDGPLMPKLKEQINELGLENQITFHGHSDVVPEVISRCDLFLFPSLDEEGLGLSLAEALCAGAPVIASDISATREFTSSGVNSTGELLPPDDAAAWAGAIDRFLDGAFVPKLKLAVSLPSEEEAVSAMLDFYSEIIAR